MPTVHQSKEGKEITLAVLFVDDFGVVISRVVAGK